MNYSTHPLSSFVSQFIDGCRACIDDSPYLNDKNDPKELVFGNNYLLPDYSNITDGGLTHAGLFAKTAMASKSVVESADDTPKLRSSIYSFIYNMHYDGLDLGSGDFSKGIHGKCEPGYYVGPDKILIDKENKRGFEQYSAEALKSNKVVLYETDFNDPRFEVFVKERMQEAPTSLITAVNSIMHIKSIDFLKEYDAVFTIPCPAKMHAANKIEKIDDSTYKMCKGVYTNVEYDHGLKLDTSGSAFQSVGIFVRKKLIKLIRVEVCSKLIKEHTRISLSRKPDRLNDIPRDEFTGPFVKKMDGMTCVVLSQDGMIYYKTPFVFKIYKIDDFAGHPFESFEFEGELLEGNVLVPHLLISLAGSTLPFNAWEMLNAFFENTSFQSDDSSFPLIATKRLFVDVDSCLTTPETFGDCRVTLAEGVVNMQGVAGKVVETLDLDNHTLAYLVDTFKESLELDIIHDYIPKEQIWECKVLKIKNDIVIKTYRPRTDKAIPNSYDRCYAFIMDLIGPHFHHLSSYISDDVLSRYKIYTKNL